MPEEGPTLIIQNFEKPWESWIKPYSLLQIKALGQSFPMLVRGVFFRKGIVLLFTPEH